jgi:hypothetical protein
MIANYDNPNCIACNDTGQAYWSEGYYGNCFNCDINKVRKTKKMHLRSKEMGSCEVNRKSRSTKKVGDVTCKTCIKRNKTNNRNKRLAKQKQGDR